MKNVVTLQRLRDRIESFGATLEVHNEYRRIEYEAIAPAGMHWESGLTALLSSCFKGPGAAAEARRDCFDRVMEYDLEPCSEAVCGLCNAAAPEGSKAP